MVSIASSGGEAHSHSRTGVLPFSGVSSIDQVGGSVDGPFLEGDNPTGDQFPHCICVLTGRLALDVGSSLYIRDNSAASG